MDPRKAKFDDVTNELNNIFTHYETLNEIINNPQVQQELATLKKEISDLQKSVISVVKPTDVDNIQRVIDTFDNLRLDTNDKALQSRLNQVDAEVNRLSNMVSSASNQKESVAQPAQPTESTTKKESRKNEEKEYGTFGKMKDSFQAVKKPFKSAMKQLKESIQEKVDDFRPKSKR